MCLTRRLPRKFPPCKLEVREDARAELPTRFDGQLHACAFRPIAEVEDQLVVGSAVGHHGSLVPHLFWSMKMPGTSHVPVIATMYSHTIVGTRFRRRRWQRDASAPACIGLQGEALMQVTQSNFDSETVALMGSVCDSLARYPGDDVLSVSGRLR
jgi:hypothetical protein